MVIGITMVIYASKEKNFFKSNFYEGSHAKTISTDLPMNNDE